jgi:hypothetical protein
MAGDCPRAKIEERGGIASNRSEDYRTLPKERIGRVTLSRLGYSENISEQKL